MHAGPPNDRSTCAVATKNDLRLWNVDAGTTSSVSIDGSVLSIMWLSDGLDIVMYTGEVKRFSQTELDAFSNQPDSTESASPVDAAAVISDIDTPVEPRYEDKVPSLCVDTPAETDELNRDRFERKIAEAFRNPVWFGILRSLREAVEPNKRFQRVGFRVREFLFRASSTGGPFAAVTAILMLITVLIAANGTSTAALTAALGIPTLVVALLSLSRDFRRRLNWDSFSSGRLASDDTAPPMGEVEALALWYRRQAGQGPWFNRGGLGLIALPMACVLMWWVLEKPTVKGASISWRQSWATSSSTSC